MKFYQRLAYYLLGVFLGGFVVAGFFMKKKTQCNYMPNARVLNNIKSKPLEYSLEASRKLSEDWVDSIDIKNSLQYGDVDFDKSNVKRQNGKLYIIEGKTTKNDTITLKVVNYPKKAVLEDIIRKR
jgi:hypothetical protein